MYEASKSTCHDWDWTSKDEVENYKEEIFVEKDKFIAKKQIENKDIFR